MAFIGKKPTPAPLTSSDITDGIISNAKLAQDLISAETELATAPADTDELLISDAGTLKRIDASLVGGKGLLQIIQTFSTTQQNFTNTSSYTDLTGVTANITPASSSNKVLVIASIHGDGDVGDRGYGIKIIRDSTDIFTEGNVKGVYGNTRNAGRNTTIYLDTPNTTSQITYKCAAKTDGGGHYFQMSNNASILTLMEVAV